MDAEVYENIDNVAKAAAEYAVEVLKEAIELNGTATWVLAGGSTPMAAYRILAKDHVHSLDWKKVTIAIGDERCVPFDHPDSNWGSIIQVLEPLSILKENQITPTSITNPKTAAVEYENAIESLAVFDLVWLGMGEDGHTLSLFPGHEQDLRSERLVIPALDSPKPPAERITLTLKALERTRHCYILAAGAGKADVVSLALAGDRHLPIARAAMIISESDGTVTWLIDEAAAMPQPL
jgi:6-phosphogluconolactonase